jgi:hypothetical protein
MPLSPSVRRPAAAAALGAALLTTAFAGVAGAATISKQATLKPGATIPVDFAGFKEPANNKLPSGYVILKRTATMHPGEVHVFNGKPITAKITAPTGYTLLTVKEKGRVDWRAPSGFIGKRSMTVTLTSESVDPGKDTASGTYYVLAKRGNTNA